MAVLTTTYPLAGRDRFARIAEHNASLLARQPILRRRARTPEFFLTKNFDNSRLVKSADPTPALTR